MSDSLWTPLRRHAVFRRLWLAGVVSNVGTWMQNVGAVWVDHLRQHERVTVEDRAVLDAARAFPVGDEPVRVSHLVAVPMATARARRT